MAKKKTMYVCSHCGAESVKWLGRCNVCGEWNSYKEIHIGTPSSSPLGLSDTPASRPIPLTEVDTTVMPRILTRNTELDRVLGGGIVPGSLILLGGEPGIGKSTLLLQVVLTMQCNVLYVSGEESSQQLKMRADRLGDSVDSVQVLCETQMERILNVVKETHPEVIVVDSIQTLTTERQDSLSGSVSQIRECATILLKLAKESSIPIILVGHITKDGVIAGPKVLEHIVDVVLQFEGDRQNLYRILRPQKNRFGSTSELGVFEMRGDGLHIVRNPSGMLLTETEDALSGMSVCAAVEGAQPFLIEVQALVSSAVYGMPQRSATGFDIRRMNMLLAVLEKRIGFKLGKKDVFLNIAGGMKVVDTAMDLSVIASVLSSHVDTPIDAHTVMVGEVGLSGEIRPVSRISSRISEAAKLGFTQMLLPYQNYKTIGKVNDSLQLVAVKTVTEALRILFG